MNNTQTVNSTEPVRLIYCGPNLGKGILLQATIYKQGLPEHLNALFDKCPEIKALFVPVQDFKKALSEIKQPGTYFYRLYQVAQEFSKRGVI